LIVNAEAGGVVGYNKLMSAKTTFCSEALDVMKDLSHDIALQLGVGA